jgi:integrase
MAKITKRLVESLKPLPSADLVVFDGELPRFGIRVKPSGVRSFIVQYRNAHGRSRRLTLGGFPTLTAEAARQRALKMLADVEAGQDPAERRHEALRELTVRGFSAIYLERQAEAKKKPASVRNDRLLLRLHVLPGLGTLKLSAVTPRDVSRLHHEMRVTPFAANRVAALLSKMFNLAVSWGGLPADHPNPVRGLERFKERRVQRPLTLEEVGRFGAALAAAERERTELPSAILAQRALLLTGCRVSEVLRLRWTDLDLDGHALVLSDSKVGARRVPIGAAAIQLLTEARSRRADDSPWVCPGKNPEKPLVGLFKSFKRVCARAGLEPVPRIHDLRHGYASLGVSSGVSLRIVGEVLGHREVRTTDRYAAVARSAAHAAADGIAGTLAAAMHGTPDAEVIPLSPGAR